MAKYTHNFIEEYDDLIGFGMDRETDENTIICYLQMFSNDELMNKIVKKLKDEELEEIFSLLTRLMKSHLSEPEYHQFFLKDNHQ